ncbi:MAG: hypothetical protein ACE5D6_02120 [Candidatus Zixiibacteriota bacterium]
MKIHQIGKVTNLRIVQIVTVLINLIMFSSIGNAAILSQEHFDDANFTSRGWYDNTSGFIISTTEHIPGSTGSVEFHFLQGATQPTSGGAIRKLFTPTTQVYVSFYIKYSANYTGSNQPYHPHEFFLMTTENDAYRGPAYSYLTAYIEHNEGEPVLAIQDGQNIDETQIGVDLSSVTENRSVAGCNGSSDSYPAGTCYVASPTTHWNGKQWRAGSVYFQDNPGSYYKNDWHLVEAFFKLNSIDVHGKGQPDGEVKYWFEGVLIIDHTDVALRTGQRPNMAFNQLLIAPWIAPTDGSGSPIDQKMWVDNLTIATSRPTDSIAPSPPTNLNVQ